ncbi:MAG: aminotransferase class IV [Pyrinomonadaceae bacterium]
MRDFIFFNRQILPAENACLSVISSAALYGRGIFTTVAIYNSKPFLWEKHWRRLTSNARKIKIDLSDFSERSVSESLFEIIEKNRLKRARARITFFDESVSEIWKIETNRQTSLLIQTAELRRVKNKFNLTVSPFRVNTASPLVGVKSCNYLENILALEDAKANRFDEAIRLNEKGEIVSACMANLFWKKRGAIFTPHLETGCVNGTTRKFILENFPVTEIKADFAELKKADEIFLTSAGIGIVKAGDLTEAQAN